MDGQDEGHGLRFAEFEFDPDSLELHRDGEIVALQHKPARALALLLRHAGDVVRREELRDELWDDGVHIEFDQSLNACIRRLRAALDDDPDDPDFVQTLPRRGYRFVARVERLGPARPDPEAASPRGPEPDRGPSRPGLSSRALLVSVSAVLVLILAVAALVRPAPTTPGLALLRLDVGAEVEDGRREVVSDELALALVRRLDGEMVLILPDEGDPDASAEGVGYLIDGSISGDGDRVRLTLSLLRAPSREPVWSDVYEGGPDQATWRSFADRAAAEIVSRLEARSPRLD